MMSTYLALSNVVLALHPLKELCYFLKALNGTVSSGRISKAFIQMNLVLHILSKLISRSNHLLYTILHYNLCPIYIIMYIMFSNGEKLKSMYYCPKYSCCSGAHVWSTRNNYYVDKCKAKSTPLDVFSLPQREFVECDVGLGEHIYHRTLYIPHGTAGSRHPLLTVYLCA